MDKAALIEELKVFIIDTLDLEDVEPDEIDETQPLFAEDLGLTSIDMLELTVGIEKKYKIKIGNIDVAKKVFNTMDDLAQFIIDNHRE